MRYQAIVGRLVARTAVHVGSGRVEETTDAVLRRDVQGNLLIPGTAVAGALRSLATRLAPRLGNGDTGRTCRALVAEPGRGGGACECVVCQLFGDVRPGEDEDFDGSGGRASRLWVYDAPLDTDSPSTSVRDMVGIERSTGTAAREAAAKFDLELLPAGSVFRLRLEFDPDTDTGQEALLAAALSEWTAGRAALGGRVARGLGAFELEDPHFLSLPIESADELMAFLRSDEPWKLPNLSVDTKWVSRLAESAGRCISPAASPHPAVARSYATLTFDLQADDLFLTHDEEAAVWGGFDHAPLLDYPGPDGKPRLSGAALRGVIRTQAERIARTLATQQANDLASFGALCPACDPLVSPAQRRRSSGVTEYPGSNDGDRVREARSVPLASCDSMLRAKRQRQGRVDRGEATSSELCLACRLFGNPRLGSRLRVEDAPLAGDASVSRKALDFLAIDRFTGGGKEGAKFDALALWQPCFHARLHLENPESWELGWLILVLRDLHEGLVRLGFGAAKGFGQVRLRNLTVRLGFLDSDDLKDLMPQVRLGSPPRSGIYREHILSVPDLDAQGAFSILPHSWVQTFVARRFDRARTDMVLEADSYFGRTVPAGRMLTELYPREVATHEA